MNRSGWLRWLGVLSAIALLTLVGVYTYDLGVAHGLAESAAVSAREMDPFSVGGGRGGSDSSRSSRSSSCSGS